MRVTVRVLGGHNCSYYYVSITFRGAISDPNVDSPSIREERAMGKMLLDILAALAVSICHTSLVIKCRRFQSLLHFTSYSYSAINIDQSKPLLIQIVDTNFGLVFHTPLSLVAAAGLACPW